MRLSGWLTLLLSFLFSILLMIAPVAPWLSDIWPIWIIPVMAYWIMALPHRVGLLSAWASGILLDILYNSLLGSHALALLILAAIFRKISRQFSFLSVIQQMLILIIMSLIYVGILTLAALYDGKTASDSFWWPIITTALVWPLTSALLQHYRRRFRMT